MLLLFWTEHEMAGIWDYRVGVGVRIEGSGFRKRQVPGYGKAGLQVLSVVGGGG